MFKAKAILKDSEGSEYAILKETSNAEDHARIEVKLRRPFTLQGTERLEIHVSFADDAVISIGSEDSQEITLKEFEGVSSLGRINDTADVTLVRTPGGQLGTLLLLLAKGTISEEHD